MDSLAWVGRLANLLDFLTRRTSNYAEGKSTAMEWILAGGIVFLAYVLKPKRTLKALERMSVFVFVVFLAVMVAYGLASAVSLW